MTLGVIVMIIILAIAIPMFAQKGDKITLAGKLGSEPSIITNMYKNFNRRRDQKYCRSERWYGENSIFI